MIELKPELRQPLVERISHAFDQEELNMLARYNLGQPLSHLVAPGKDVPATVLALVEAVERRGTLELLLRGVVLARPDRADLTAFCQTHFPQVFVARDTAALVENVKSGLAALIERAADPQVRLTVGRFLADFDTARDQIRTVKRYKALHDILHNVQLQLPEIAASAARFRTSGTEAVALMRYARQLEQHGRAASQHAVGLATEVTEERWAVDLTTSAAGMQAAARGGKPDDVAAAIDGFGGVRSLLSHASRINSLLTLAASGMRLEKLIEALAAISRDLGAGADAPRRARALNAMTELHPTVSALVVEHNEWQWLDAALTAGETSPARAPEARVPRWPQVRDALQHLCGSFRRERWAVDLSTTMQAWSDAAAAGSDDANAADVAFNDFRFIAGQRFFEVDVELKEMCAQLAEVAGPLDTVLKVMTDVPETPGQ